MNNKRWIIVSALIVIGLALAACGGGVAEEATPVVVTAAPTYQPEEEVGPAEEVVVEEVSEVAVEAEVVPEPANAWTIIRDQDVTQIQGGVAVTLSIMDGATGHPASWDDENLYHNFAIVVENEGSYKLVTIPYVDAFKKFEVTLEDGREIRFHLHETHACVAVTSSPDQKLPKCIN